MSSPSMVTFVSALHSSLHESLRVPACLSLSFSAHAQEEYSQHNCKIEEAALLLQALLS